MLGLPDLPGPEETAQTNRPRRPWREKFRDALRGWKFGIRGHSSFFVHFFCAALVLAAAGALQCSLEQWALLLLCIGIVLTTELFNSAIETFHRGLDDLTKEGGAMNSSYMDAAGQNGIQTAFLIGKESRAAKTPPRLYEH